MIELLRLLKFYKLFLYFSTKGHYRFIFGILAVVITRDCVELRVQYNLSIVKVIN